METKKHVKIANQAFLRGDYSLAIVEYQEASRKYGSRLFDYNINLCKSRINELSTNKISTHEILNTRKDGVSVIVPSYGGEATIEKCIESLACQVIDKRLYEVIVIFNGKLDSSESILENLMQQHQDLNLKILKTSIAGVGNARNMGVENSSFKYLTFVDDDDNVSPNYLSAMYEYASAGAIVISQILDYDGVNTSSNTVNEHLFRNQQSNRIKYNDVSPAITLNACKLVPFELVSKIKYDDSLKSGEDVVYWMEVIAKSQPTLKIVPFEAGCIYYRTLKANSVSRQKETYDFNVSQRLRVIQGLYKTLVNSTTSEVHEFIMSKVRAQLGFCVRYLAKNEDQYLDFLKESASLGLDIYVRKYVNMNIAKDLVISYCFPPYVDTAGVVAAKRIKFLEKPVDVLSNKMDKARTKSETLNRIAEDFIGENIALPTPTAFSNWDAIKKFSIQALESINRIESKKGKYKSVYSRAMWPASHIAAAALKAKNPEIKWLAEFSDPLYLNINGEIRKDLIEKSWLQDAKILDYIKERNYPLPVSDHLFYYCEYLPYVMADELIFTNENQMRYMLESFPDGDWIKDVVHKVKIIPQPTLPFYYYKLSEADYCLNKNQFNIGYFGSFYENRGLGEVFKAVSKLPIEYRKKIKLHIFTEQADKVKSEPDYLAIKDFVVVNPYLNYFEFLNLTTKLDCLFVNDTSTIGRKKFNPYLPSKISDYLGSGVKIWGACEKESSMYQLAQQKKLDFCSYLGDQESYDAVILQLKQLISNDDNRFG